MTIIGWIDVLLFGFGGEPGLENIGMRPGLAGALSTFVKGEKIYVSGITWDRDIHRSHD